MTTELRPDTTVAVHDVSVLVGTVPTYTQIAFGNPEWDVVAICADQETLEKATSVEVSIVPAVDASPSFLDEARDGDHDITVTCDGRPHR